MGNRIVIDPVTRIEGHARIELDIDDAGAVKSGHLEVLEIRGFEKLLEGMELFKMPLITARICGVCPAAHHMASVTAIENGLGVEVPSDANLLRELMYLGHTIHSHALSAFVLSGPDVICGLDAAPGQRNIFALLKLAPEIVMKALRIRTIGQRIVEIVGGRGVHPVTSVPGGLSSRPTADEIAEMQSMGKEGLTLVTELSEALSKKFVSLTEIHKATYLPFHAMALSNGGKVDLVHGDCLVIDPDGKEVRRFTAGDYIDHLVEHTMAGSYMKSVRLKAPEEIKFFVGPLARLLVNEAYTTSAATRLMEEFNSEENHRNSALDNIKARIIEMVYCAERIIAITGGEFEDGPIRVDVKPEEGRYIGLIEAPRGILIHDYTVDTDGKLTAANLIVATQNNYDAIDHSITAMAELLKPLENDNLLMNGIEFALRCFDPCLACATHATGRMPMEVILKRENRVLRKLSRRT